MAPAKTDLEGLANAFRHSWLNSQRCLEFLESDVIRRQNIIVLGGETHDQSPGWRNDQAPLKLSDLVGMVAGCFAREHLVDFLTISLGCALAGELLVTVHTSRPGTILRLSPREDERRLFVQAPFEPLRNTLCHPGMLPEGPANDGNAASFTSLLQMLNKRYADQQALIQRLERSRHEIAGFDMARWCLGRIDELGQFEIVQAVLDELRRKKVSVALEDEIKVAKTFRFKDALERLLDRHPKANQVSDLFSQ